jgi:hypothetical protein
LQQSNHEKEEIDRRMDEFAREFGRTPRGDPRRKEIADQLFSLCSLELVILTLLLFARVAFTADSWQEPDGFKEYKFGMTAAEITDVRARTGRGTAGLSVKESLGEVLVDTNFSYYWDRSVPSYPVQRLGMITLDFPERNYKIVRDAFVARYGQPTSSRDVLVAKFQGEVLEWEGQKVNILIRQYAGKRTESDVIIFSRTWAESKIAEENERARKAAGDLR